MEPLLRLHIGNLRDAIDLGLIETSAAAITRCEVELANMWAGGSHTIEKWDDGNSRLSSVFDRALRPLQAYRGRKLPITRVFPIRNLPYLFRDLPSDIGNESDVKRALSAIASASATASDRSAIEQAFDQIRIRVCPQVTRETGVSLYVKNLAPRGTPCWVGRRSRFGPRSSQHWRDCLGLEHLPFREGRTRPLVQGDALVRVTFVATLSSSELIRDDYKSSVRLDRQGLWLVRPTAVHGGNTRFVQRQENDSVHEPRKQGRTINIETRAYLESVREAILLHGQRAMVDWLDMELFEGLPMRRDQDDDHAGFLATIGSRHGWS